MQSCKPTACKFNKNGALLQAYFKLFSTENSYFVEDLPVAASKWIKTDILFNIMVKERCEIHPVIEQIISIIQ